MFECGKLVCERARAAPAAWNAQIRSEGPEKRDERITAEIAQFARRAVFSVVNHANQCRGGYPLPASPASPRRAFHISGRDRRHRHGETKQIPESIEIVSDWRGVYLFDGLSPFS